MSLLSREQTRLMEREAITYEQQALTVATNVNLIMSEIKTGTLLALEAASGDGDEAARLGALTATNPLVASTYLWTPASDGTFTQQFTSGESPSADIDLHTPPWGKAPEEKKKTITLKKETESTGDRISSRSTSSYSNAQSKRTNIREFTQYNVQNLNTLKQQEQLRDNKFDDITPIQPIRRSDWIQSSAPEPTWFVWYQHNENSRVTGATLNTSTVIEQLQEALPSQNRDGIHYTLTAPNQDSPYSTLNTKGIANLLPIGPELPNWRLRYSTQTSSTGNGIILLSGLLIAILCATILGAGTLVLWRARQDARDATQKSTFVSNVSHELRTPLTTIRMYAEMLEEQRVPEPSKQQRYLKTITMESQRLTRLINNVLDFSHLSQKSKNYHSSDISMVELINDTISSQEPRLLEAGITCQWDPAGAEITAHTDPDAVEQILLNLIDNTIKYASSGKLLKIAIAQTSAHTELSISDNGQGIATRDQAKAFQPFERLDDSLTSNQPGSGLGLSICRSIANDLGGKLELISHKNQGCHFVLKLPTRS
ncbi:MAG: sensor histidine kinase [Opitutaceae bacterium]